MPDGYSPIPCEDTDYLFTQPQKIKEMYHSEVLRSRFTMVHSQKELKQQLVDHSANIYQFDDINNIQFIIPLTTKPSNLGIYVQPEEGLNFTLIRKFTVKPTHQFETEDQCANEIEYLLKMLTNWNYTITNAGNFFQHIGMTLTTQHTDLLMQQAQCLSFPSISLDAALTQRLVDELDIQCLSNYLKVLLSTFDVAGHAFNFCAITMNPNKMYGENGGSELEWFGRYQYKLSSNTDDVMVAYNDQIQIDASNEYHIDLVAKHNSLQIQTIKPLAIQPSTSFVDNLVLTDDKIVFTLHADSVNGVHRKAILNAIYLMVYQDEIDSEATMTESDGVIYQFDDINHVRFIVPFGTTSQYAHVFVKPKANFDFVFIKRLHVQRREDITNKIDYLLTALKSYDLTITNPKQFYEYVGVMMQPSDTPDVQKSMQLYAPTVMGTRITCLHRLVHELELTELSNALRAFDSKMECVGMFKAFNCNILQIVSNSECDEKAFLAQ
eukprot:402478_1